MNTSAQGTRVIILECHQLISLDTTGIDALKSLATSLGATGGHLLLCELNRQPQDLLGRSGLAADLGKNHIFADMAGALAEARRLSALPISTHCG